MTRDATPTVRPRARRCVHEHCPRLAIYGWPGRAECVECDQAAPPEPCATPRVTPQYCSEHRMPGMVDGHHRLCAAAGCGRQANFARPVSADSPRELRGARWCCAHAPTEAADVRNPRCEVHGCVERALYALWPTPPEPPDPPEPPEPPTPPFSADAPPPPGPPPPLPPLRHPAPRARWCLAHRATGALRVDRPRCADPACDRPARRHTGFCGPCFYARNPWHPRSQRARVKEQAVLAALHAAFPDGTWRANQQIPHGQSRRRPDAWIQIHPTRCVWVEVDEAQHETYDPAEEERRAREVAADLAATAATASASGPVQIWCVRFNPDGYTSASGTRHRPCWTVPARGPRAGELHVPPSRQSAWSARLARLRAEVQRGAAVETWPAEATTVIGTASDAASGTAATYTVHTMQLFFDGFDEEDATEAAAATAATT